MTRLLQCVAVWLLLWPVGAAMGQVSAYEKPIVIPTWEVGPAQIHSDFPDTGKAIYPYTLLDRLTENKVERTYRGVFLENEYVQLLILPEIGGRLHGAVDKTNGYVWLYWQRTIKPGLIAMTGAWISGGIEWNFPHGHRPSCFMPVDCRIVEHDDGSATVWVGETEPIYRMRWLVGMTLFPGRSYVRCDYVAINPTDHRHSFLFWATAATHANEQTQALFPGSLVTGHGKHEFWHWPVHDGVDISWWKNSPNASSYFAYNEPVDWFGTYDHGADAGTIHWADHHQVPGKKIWTWGSGPSGRIWEDILTEGGGPYFEPQAGIFSDNQPDYHWIEPHEVKTAHGYWYPVRGTRGVGYADRDFALNTEVKDGTAFGGVYATGVFPDCRVVLTNVKTGRALTETTADLAPDRPCTVEVKQVGQASSLPGKQDARPTVYDLHLAVYDAAGKLRTELQKKQPPKREPPKGQHDPGDPSKMTQDELYHAGEWLDRFRRTDEALNYYREALKRDPGDSRVNVEMALMALKEGKWDEALQRLDTALKRDDVNTRIYYAKGLAHAGRGERDAAYEQFYRATYCRGLFSSAYFNLARIDLARGDFEAAVAKLDRAAEQHARFAGIPALKAAALRHLGRAEEALGAAERAMELDPLHPMGGYEKLLALQRLKRPAGPWQSEWRSIMRDAVQNYLELAVAYADAGLLDEADAVLEGFARDKDEQAVNPMVNYFRGHFKDFEGDAAGAKRFFETAARGPAEYTNPHRLEGKAALETALRHNPADARAHLFLGNLLYARGQREEGFAHWRRAVEHDGRLAPAWRNVGYAERHLRDDLPKAHEAFRKAFQLDPRDARVLHELNEVARKLGRPARERLDLLDKHYDVVETRDSLLRNLIDLRLEAGGVEDLEKAYRDLSAHHFHSWEGKYEIHDRWVEVNQALGDEAFKKGRFDKALHHYREACRYPMNLEVAARTPDLRAHVFWDLARTHLAMKHAEPAAEYLKKIVAEKYTKPHLGTYYQALAQKALGNTEAYRDLLSKLHERVEDLTSGKYEHRGTRKAIGHYLRSLLLAERGDAQAAAVEARTARQLDPQVRRRAIREAQLDIAQAHQ